MHCLCYYMDLPKKLLYEFPHNMMCLLVSQNDRFPCKHCVETEEHANMTDPLLFTIHLLRSWSNFHLEIFLGSWRMRYFKAGAFKANLKYYLTSI